MREKQDVPVQMMLHQLAHLTKWKAGCRLEDLELKPGQAGILFVLNVEGILSQRELAERIGVKPPSMTVALQKMERLGYLTREPDPEDLRVIRITLTEKGKNCIGAIKEVITQTEETLFLGFSEEERILTKRLLFQMQENFMNSKDMKDVNPADLIRKMHDAIGKEASICE